MNGSVRSRAEAVRRMCNSLFIAVWLLFCQGSGNPLPAASVPQDSLPAVRRVDDAFGSPPNTQALTIPMTPAPEALARLSVPSGFHATLFASEPDVHQPIAATLDARGRLWVAECYTYSDRQQNYDTSLNDRVLIFEDTDCDGVFDRRTVFFDQAKKLTGIEVGLGGVWLTCAPQLLFIPDRDRDDRPDGPPEVVLDGFEDDVIRHNVVNGLRWGPDGWLYGRHGIQATSNVGQPGATLSQRTAINCCIWRLDTQRGVFEVVAEGGTNPWGFDYDQHGEMFMINTVIGHLFHVVPGARYRRMYGSHFNPHTYQAIEQTADHFHWDTQEPHHAVTRAAGMSEGTDLAGGGHAHTGLMIYQGNNWPPEFQNQLFTANFHGRRINSDAIQRQGNSYIAHHGPDHFRSDDPWFRGVELIYGPDGGVFLLDWSDIGECHEDDGIHRTSGRIFKVVYGQPPAPDRRDLHEFEDLELIELLADPNQWYPRTARRLLQERMTLAVNRNSNARSETRSRLHQAYREARNVGHRLNLMWTLYSTESLDAAWLISQSSDPDEHVRAWAVRLLVDGRLPIESETEQRLAELARSDPSGLVRLYVASSLRRLSTNSCVQVARELASHSEDASDRVQPHLIWFGIEPHVLSNAATAIALAIESGIPLVRENVARRIASELDRRPELLEALLKRSVECQDTTVQADVLQGIAKGLDGWQSAKAPASWSAFAKLEWITNDADSQACTQRINALFGDGITLANLLQTIRDDQADVESRNRAIQTLASQHPTDELFDLLLVQLPNRSLTNTVIDALRYFDRPEVAASLISRYRQFDPSGQRLVFDVLAARPSWADALLVAIEQEQLPRSGITASHARQIASFPSDNLKQQLEQVWGTIRDTPADRVALIDRWKQKLTPTALGQGNLARGQVLFESACASCHVLYGRGGRIGPDLTGADRRNLHYLLENIVDPSGSVAQDFRVATIAIRDGRVLTGVVVNQTDRVLELQTKDTLLKLDRNEVEALQETQQSLMPEGLIQNWPEQDVIDLIRFLAR